MLVRYTMLAAATIVCLLTLSVQAEPEETPNPPNRAADSLSKIPSGVKCRIELHPEATGQFEKTMTFYEGTIQATTNGNVVLKEASIEHRCTTTTPLTRIPYVARLFKNTGVGRAPLEEKEVQIPVEKILTITLMKEVTLESDNEEGFPPAPPLPLR